MEKVLSTRLPEEVIEELEQASRRLGITKKQFLQEAIRMRAAETSRERAREIIDRAWGAWVRDEPPEETVAAIKRAFRESAERRQRRFRGET
jgi:predicted DNA-binding transcriptional regulator